MASPKNRTCKFPCIRLKHSKVTRRCDRCPPSDACALSCRGSSAAAEGADTANDALSCFPLRSLPTALRWNTGRKSARFRVGYVETLIWTVTAQHSLFPSSLTHTVNNLPCDSSASWATVRAYHVPASSHDRVRVRPFAGGHLDDVLRPMNGASARAPVWQMPESSFGILLLTTFISDSHVLPIPGQPCVSASSLLRDSTRHLAAAHTVGLRCRKGFIQRRRQRKMLS
jgi:hypothetical protein